MKNIFILPTDQPSRLWVNSLHQGKLELSEETLIGSLRNRYIYITSDVLFKENNWVLNTDTLELYKADSDDVLLDKKDIDWYADFNLQVILTTDPTLIRDGVQSIDDEFLKWFVKNPTCEFVKVEEKELKLIYNPNYKDFTEEGNGIYLTPKDTSLQTNETLIEDNIISYQITTPQEEPKQEFLLFDKERANTITSEGQKTVRELQNTIQQETLEEAAKEFYPPTTTDLICSPKLVRDAFIAGAKWQAERMYSEEEVLELLWKREWSYEYSMPFITVDQWFEQFKKK